MTNVNRYMEVLHPKKDQHNLDGIRYGADSQRNLLGMPVCFIRSSLKGVEGYIRSFHEILEKTSSAKLAWDCDHECIQQCASCCKHLKSGHICSPRCYRCTLEKISTSFIANNWSISDVKLEIGTLSKIQTSSILDIRPSR